MEFALYYTKRAVKDFLTNLFLNAVTTITIALSMLIVSTFAIFFVNISDIMDTWKRGVRVMVYLEEGVHEIQIPEIKRKIIQMPEVGEVKYISRQEALENMKKEMKRQASLFENLQYNPLPDIFVVRMKPSAQTWTKVEPLAADIEKISNVAGVEYGQRWLGKMTGIVSIFNVSGIVMCCVFFMASVFIVANTIRLLFYSRREEFEIMRLVGATDSFIKTPFYIESAIQGLIGGVLGIFILFISFMLLMSSVENEIVSGFVQVRFLPVSISAAIVLLSVSAGLVGCYLSFKQFLNS
jgi:cell division transport system permease protein